MFQAPATQATFFAIAKLQIFSPIVYFLNTPSDYHQKVTVHASYGLLLTAAVFH